MPGAKAYTRDEIDLVLKALKTPRDRCLFTLGLATGFRVSELLSITVQDIFRQGVVLDSVSVGRVNMKGQVAARTVPLGPQARKAVIEYLATIVNLRSEMRLFPFTRQHADRILRAACSEAGLGQGYSTHSMRKTFAKRVYERLGHDLVQTQKAMGHKSVNSTVSYLAVDQDAINQAIVEGI